MILLMLFQRLPRHPKYHLFINSPVKQGEKHTRLQKIFQDFINSDLQNMWRASSKSHYEIARHYFSSAGILADFSPVKTRIITNHFFLYFFFEIKFYNCKAFLVLELYTLQSRKKCSEILLRLSKLNQFWTIHFNRRWRWLERQNSHVCCKPQRSFSFDS